MVALKCESDCLFVLLWRRSAGYIKKQLEGLLNILENTVWYYLNWYLKKQNTLLWVYNSLSTQAAQGFATRGAPGCLQQSSPSAVTNSGYFYPVYRLRGQEEQMTTLFASHLFFSFIFVLPLFVLGQKKSHLKDKTLEPNFLNTKHCCIKVSWPGRFCLLQVILEETREVDGVILEVSPLFQRSENRLSLTRYISQYLYNWCLRLLSSSASNTVRNCCQVFRKTELEPSCLHVNCSQFVFCFSAAVTLIFQSVIRSVLSVFEWKSAMLCQQREYWAQLFFVISCLSAVTLEHFKIIVFRVILYCEDWFV